MAETVKHRLMRAGGWGLAKRLIKPIPIIGSLAAVSLVVYEIRKKGLFRGAVHVGLDATPVVGTAKNVVEIFTGDLIRDKKAAPVSQTAPEPEPDSIVSQPPHRPLGEQ
jgi:hypothetical protein